MLSFLTKHLFFSQKLSLIVFRLQNFTSVVIGIISQTGIAEINLIQLLKACILSVVIRIDPSLAKLKQNAPIIDIRYRVKVLCQLVRGLLMSGSRFAFANVFPPNRVSQEVLNDVSLPFL